MSLFADVLLDGASILDKVRSFRIERRETQAVDVLTLALADYSLYSQFDFTTLPQSERVHIGTANGTPKTNGSTVGTGVLTSAGSTFSVDGVTLDDLIHVIDSSIAADIGTWAITVVGTTTLISSHTFGTATSIKFIVLKNQGRFFAEKPDVSETKDNLSIPSLWGRVGLARLTDPFSLKITKTFSEKTTMSALVKQLVKDTGMDDTKVQIDISDYSIPAGIFSISQKLPLDVIVELASKTNGYVRCKRTGDLWIKKKLFHIDGLSADFSIGDSDLRGDSQESLEFPEFGNRILIRSSLSASGQNVQVQLKLETRCIRGDGFASTQAEAVITDGIGDPVPNGTLVDFSIDDDTLATFAATQRETGTRIIIGESQRASSLLSVSASYPIKRVIGVFLENDDLRAKNLYTGGSFKARTITLGTETPFSDSAVLVDYVAAGIAVATLVSVAGASEDKTEVHAAVGRIRSSTEFCISNRRNISIDLTAKPTEHNLCIQGNRTSQIFATVKIDGQPGSGAMVQWLVEGNGSISPSFSAVTNNPVTGEIVIPVDRSTVGVTKEIVEVQGVWLLSQGKNGTNYYTNQAQRSGSISENVITLGTDLPNTSEQVMVDYTTPAVAEAIYRASDKLGSDKIVAKMVDGTTQGQETSISINVVNNCAGDAGLGGPGAGVDPPGGKNDCSKAAASAKVCATQNPNDNYARVECTCKQEGESGGCPTTDSGCKDMCEKAYARSQSNPLGCESLPTSQQISAAQDVMKRLITTPEAKPAIDCIAECGGNPDCVEVCVKAHKADTVGRCTANCRDHGLALDEATKEMPCGQANPSVTFTVKGTGKFFWANSKGDFIISEDSKSATLKPGENPGSGVAGNAYVRETLAIDEHCNIPILASRYFGCNDNVIQSCGLGGSGHESAQAAAKCGGSGPTCVAPGNWFNGMKGIMSDAEACACVGGGHTFDLRTPSMIAAGCNPCGNQFIKPAVIRVTDKRGNAVQGTVTS